MESGLCVSEAFVDPFYGGLLDFEFIPALGPAGTSGTGDISKFSVHRGPVKKVGRVEGVELGSGEAIWLPGGAAHC